MAAGSTYRGKKTGTGTWFRALEDESLGTPTEMSVDKLEWRLHQLFDDQPERPALRSCYLHNSLQLCRTPVF